MLSKPRYPQAETLAELERNFAEINGRIQAACRRAGRHPDSVRLLPVTKTVDERRIRMAHALGYACFGENKVQEAWGKWQEMQDLPLDWVVIGHLQTNKIKYVAKFAAEFQALDSLRVAEQLDARLASEGRTLDVLVQVNTSGEASKYGLAPEAAEGFVHALAPFPPFESQRLDDACAAVAGKCGSTRLLRFAAQVAGAAATRPARRHVCGRTVDGDVRRF